MEADLLIFLKANINALCVRKPDTRVDTAIPKWRTIRKNNVKIIIVYQPVSAPNYDRRNSTEIPQIFQRFHRSKFIRSAVAEPTTPAIIMPIIGVMMVPSVSAFAGLFEL